MAYELEQILHRVREMGMQLSSLKVASDEIAKEEEL
jgi:hypothetical protein